MKACYMGKRQFYYSIVFKNISWIIWEIDAVMSAVEICGGLAGIDQVNVTRNVD